MTQLLIEETLEPDTPKMRALARLIREDIETLGWEEFEQGFVEAAGLVLVREEGGMRYYERPDGQLKVSIGWRLYGRAGR